MPEPIRTGLTGASSSLRGGLTGAIGAIQEGVGQGRRDIMDLINNQQNSTARAGSFNNRYMGSIDQGVSALEGFAAPGRQAVNQQAALSGALGSQAQQQAFQNFNESPGQSYLREQMERAVMRNAAKTGGLGGGNVLQELQRQAMGLAQQDLDAQFGRLGQVSGMGLQAAGQQGQLYGDRAALGNQLGIAQGQAQTQANIASAQNRNSLAQALGGQLGQMSLQGGLAAGDASLRTGQNLANYQYGTGQQIANELMQTGGNLAQLQAAAGQGAQGILGTQSGNLAQLLAGAGQAGSQQQANFAQMLANLASGAGGQVAGLPGLGGSSGGGMAGIGSLLSGAGTLVGAFR